MRRLNAAANQLGSRSRPVDRICRCPGATRADDWNKFDIHGLRGIRHTAPYFHNNSAATLEDVVDHYVEFFKRVQANAAPGVVPPIASTDGVNFDRPIKPEERAALLAYLRKL